jgi:mono/diheme cytochrome c family protein
MRTTRIALLLAAALLVSITAIRAAEDGKALFESKCAVCHGTNGVPKSIAKASPTLSDPKWQKSTTVAAIEKQITEGKAPTMKPFKDKLTPEQIKAVAEYVLTLK